MSALQMLLTTYDSCQRFVTLTVLPPRRNTLISGSLWLLKSDSTTSR